jgi:hypothetical protein
MGRTRHWVFTEEVVDLTSCEFLDLYMSAIHLNGKEEITKYVLLLSAVVVITAYLLNNMAALSAGFKLANCDACW